MRRVLAPFVAAALIVAFAGEAHPRRIDVEKAGESRLGAGSTDGGLVSLPGAGRRTASAVLDAARAGKPLPKVARLTTHHAAPGVSSPIPAGRAPAFHPKRPPPRSAGGKSAPTH